MSRDQRPGKIKVVNTAAPVQNRRRTDRKPQEGRVVAVVAAEPAPEPASGAFGLILAMLFLLGSAGGGVGLVLIGRLG